MSSTITEQKEFQNSSHDEDDYLYNEILPETIMLEYLFYEDALITATKFVPFLYERCNGITTITTSKKSKQIVIATGTKQTFIFKYISSDGLKRFNVNARSNAFAILLHCFDELKKLEGVQINLVEDPQQKLFCISLNKIEIVKASYNVNDIYNVSTLNDIKNKVLGSYNTSLPDEIKGREYAKYVITKYNSIKLSQGLFLNKSSHQLVFLPSERISVSCKELPMLNPDLKRPGTVGTSLDITSERNDRYDHDD